jgi:hypothetical protein
MLSTDERIERLFDPRGRRKARRLDRRAATVVVEAIAAARVADAQRWWAESAPRMYRRLDEQRTAFRVQETKRFREWGFTDDVAAAFAAAAVAKHPLFGANNYGPSERYLAGKINKGPITGKRDYIDAAHAKMKAVGVPEKDRHAFLVSAGLVKQRQRQRRKSL